MEKSHVGLEQNQCPVCGCIFETGNILLNKRLRKTLDHYNVTDYGMCPEHQKLHNDGYIALIETASVPEGVTLKIGEADRTGNVAHIKKDLFKELFDKTLPLKGVAFITPEAFALLEKLNGEHHEH